MVRSYCPDRGDFVWICFDPHAGHEQAGHRPALVISPEAYNRMVGLVLLCPVTSRRKGYPFEVPTPPGCAISGVILADQIKSMDWRARKASFCCRAPDAVLGEVIAKAQSLLER